MPMRRAAGLVCAVLLLFLLLPGTGLDARWSGPAERIDDAVFWRLFSEFSEPSGFFQSENLVSNERTFPAIIPEITSRSGRAGAYIGVGPEQNFTYIAALRPRIAFIVDVRRQNAVLHLLYKALFELSPNRAEFLSRLFSRPRPRHLTTRSSARELLEAYAIVPPSADLHLGNLADVRTQLVEKHGFALTSGDLHALDYVYVSFFDAGPDLRYSFRSNRRGRPFPTYSELMTAGNSRSGSFLATEERYQAVRDLQLRNLVVPVVGNFAGDRSLKALGAYVKERGLTVTTFYTSNVEFYLFRNDQWRSFYSNVATLPVDSRSVLVRSAFRGFGLSYPGGSTEGTLLVDPIGELVAAFQRGSITDYADVLARSQ
jgi:hypothetical protein